MGRTAEDTVLYLSSATKFVPINWITANRQRVGVDQIKTSSRGSQYRARSFTKPPNLTGRLMKYNSSFKAKKEDTPPTFTGRFPSFWTQQLSVMTAEKDVRSV